MMQPKIELLDKVSDYYEDEIIASLEAKEKSIKEIFNLLIETEAVNYDLVSTNSVHRSVYVKVSSRVKKRDSLREKLIRKNHGLRLISDLELTVENFNSKKAQVSNEIERFDDIVGLRLICDLSKDCIKALEMIKDNISFLKQSKIVFLDGEVENQPQQMKNGLKIYRLKGLYDDRIGFELQIKSKIDEAWGELDHFIFYKDYSFFPTKDAVQQTMNNTGKLLEEIENLLFDLRSSKDEYNRNLNNSLFLEKLEKCFSKSIKSFLGFPYQIEKMSTIIEYLITKEESEIFQSEKEYDLNFDFLSFTANNNHSTYIKSRSLSFELKLLEAIFQVIWEEKHERLTQLNYDVFLETFINYLNEDIISKVTKSNSLLDYSIDKLNSDKSFLLRYNSNENAWISAKKYTSFYSLEPLINDLIHEQFEDEIEANELLEEEIDIVVKIILCLHFEADFRSALAQEKTEYTQKIIFKVKEELQKIEDKDYRYKKIFEYTDRITNSFKN
jgi:ppGpp synthetase/RelA/SpoT-type nucleotidyltranferase